MTRKDYVAIAAALKSTKPSYNSDHVTLAVVMQHRASCVAVAKALANDNPRFDRERFLDACGVVS